MATITFKLSADMDDLSIWSGAVLQATSSKLVLYDEYSAMGGVYYGSGLRYSEYEVVGGTVTGYDEAVDVVSYSRYTLSCSIRGLKLNAVTVQDYIINDDAAGLYEWALSGNDTITGSKYDDILNGYAGNDKITGGDGNDTLDGDAGKDTLIGGNGDDFLSGGVGADSLDGGNGDDFLASWSEKDVLKGGNGADAFSFILNDGDTFGGQVTDFKSGVDALAITFDEIEANSENFKIGAKLTSSIRSNCYFTYDTSSGKIYYDADANGSNAGVCIVTLVGKPQISTTDLFF